MTPMVTIELDEYNKLKDIEFQMSLIVDKVTIKNESYYDPVSGNNFKRKTGEITRRDFDYFFKNLLNIDEVYINFKEGV